MWTQREATFCIADHKTHYFALFALMLFTQLINSQYIELNPDSIDSYIKERNILIKFYGSKCSHCMKMEEAFYESANMFSNFTFGGYLCDDPESLCSHNFHVKGYPTIRLYPEEIEYNGDRSAENIAQFVQNHTGQKPHFFTKAPESLNPYTYKKTIEKNSVITFCVPYTSECKKWKPDNKIIASAFENENVTIGWIDCQQYADFCRREKNIVQFPTFMLYKNEHEYKYEGPYLPSNAIQFMNINFGTDRGIDGYLSDSAGIVSEASEIAARFCNSKDKESELSKMKQIPNTEFYVQVMNRLIKNGCDSLPSIMATMRKILDDHKGSIQSLDGIKKRYNIFAEFEHVPETREELSKYPPGPDYDRIAAKYHRRSNDQNEL